MRTDALKSLLSKFPAMETITEGMHGLMIFAALVVLPGIFTPEELPTILVWYGLAFLVAFLLRLFSSVVWPIFTTVVLFVALPFLPIWDLSLAAQIFLSLGLAFITLRAFVMRLSDANGQPGSLLMSQVAAIGYLLALTLVATHFELTRVVSAYFYIAVVYMLLALYRWHRFNLMLHLSRFDNMPSQPAQSIRRFNQFLLVGFSAIMLVFLLISPVLGLHRFMPVLGSAMLAIMRWLIQWLTREGNGDIEPTRAPETTTETTTTEEPFLPLPEATEPARWLQVAQDILYYALMIIGVAFILFLLGYLLYLAYKRFYEMQRGQDETESLVPKLGEDFKESLKKTRRRIRQQFGRSPEQKIRRIYWKTVEQLVEAGMQTPRKMSPRHFCRKVKDQAGLDLSPMAPLYEKARYGPGSCSRDDLQKMQDIYQDFRRQKKKGLQVKVKKDSGLLRD